MLQSPNRFGSCYIITQVLNLQKIWRLLQEAHTTHYSQINTADGSPMSAIGTMTLHLRIAEFKFTHNFIIYDQLPETELIFGIDMQRKFSLSHAWDKERNCYVQKEGKF